jgi:hypothetical protein
MIEPAPDASDNSDEQETKRPRRFIRGSARPASQRSLLLQCLANVIESGLNLGVSSRMLAELTFSSREQLGRLPELRIGISLWLFQFGGIPVPVGLRCMLTLLPAISGAFPTCALLVAPVQFAHGFVDMMNRFLAIAAVVVVGVFQQMLGGVELLTNPVARRLTSAGASADRWQRTRRIGVCGRQQQCGK